MEKSKLTDEWTEYNHDPEKVLQHIKCKDGSTHFLCWPNAGVWHSSEGKQIKDEDVTHTRLSEPDLNH